MTYRAGPERAPVGYELLRPIGSGASSVVWEAVQQSTGRAIALKMLDADISDRDTRRRFDRERDVMAALATHAGIVTIHDAGVQDGRPWLAMELCRRGSLAAHTAEAGPMTLPTALVVLGRLASALADAHRSGVVHCDIKPANIMLSDGGEPALGDFGIARVSVGRATTTTLGGFSLDHVAPELLDNGHTSTRSDIYSLGTTMWELIAGRPPFRGESDVSVASVIQRIMTRPMPPLPPPFEELDGLLHAMTCKDPAERVQSMDEVAALAATLTNALAERPVGPPFPSAPLVEPTSRRPALQATDGNATILRSRGAAPQADSEADVDTLSPRRRMPSPLMAAVMVGAVLLLGAGTVGYVSLAHAAPERVSSAPALVGIPTGVPTADVAASVDAAGGAPSAGGGQPFQQPAVVAVGSPVGGTGAPDGNSGGPGGGTEPGLQPPLVTASVAPPLKPVPAPIQLVTTALPRPTVGATYSAALTASGGTKPYRWAISGGGLPTGLTLNGSGTIAGTPTTPTPGTFTVTVTDSAGVSASRRLTLSPTAAIGDINRDGPVDCVDKNILLSQYNQTGSGLSGDINGSGKVDIADLSMLLSHWTGNGNGTTC